MRQHCILAYSVILSSVNVPTYGQPSQSSHLALSRASHYQRCTSSHLSILTHNDSFERGLERKAHAIDYPQRLPEGHVISGCERFAAINSSDKSKLSASRAFTRHCTNVQSSFPSKMDEKEWMTLLRKPVTGIMLHNSFVCLYNHQLVNNGTLR